MDYLLDTNIILIYGRETEISTAIEEKYHLFDANNSLAVSIVTLGEIDAIIKKLDMGEKRKAHINTIISRLAKVKIDSKEVISRYGDIDAFRQGKLQKKGDFSARNMGKNDIWIAATALSHDITLITNDNHFLNIGQIKTKSTI